MIARTLLSAAVIAAMYTDTSVNGAPIAENEEHLASALREDVEHQLDSKAENLGATTVEESEVHNVAVSAADGAETLLAEESHKSVALSDAKPKAESSSGIPGFSSLPGIDTVTGMGQATQSQSGRPMLYMGSFQMMTMPMPTAAEMAGMLQQIGPVMQQLQGLAGAAGAAGGAPAAG